MTTRPTQQRVLRLLSLAALSVNQLAKALGLTSNAIRCALTKLERLGYVFRTTIFRFVTGRRVGIFHLTRQGLDQAKEINP